MNDLERAQARTDIKRQRLMAYMERRCKEAWEEARPKLAEWWDEYWWTDFFPPENP